MEEHGAIVVAITRLVPVFPFNVLNYGFGLTGVRFHMSFGHGYVCCPRISYVVGTDTILRGISERQYSWLLVFVLLLAAIVLLLSILGKKEVVRQR